MFYSNAIPLLITLLLLPQVFVHGGILRVCMQKFKSFFKWSTKTGQSGPFYDDCNLCNIPPCTPMIWPSQNNFDGSGDAEKIMTALTGSGNLDENQKATVANILIERSAPQRTAIAEAIMKKKKKEIVDLVDAKMDRFWRYYMFIEFMGYPLPKLISKELNYATQIITSNRGRSYQIQGPPMIVEMLISLPKCLLDKAIEIYNSKGQNFIINLDNALKQASKPTEYREVIKNLVEQKRDTSKQASWFKALTKAYKLKSAVIARRETEMKEIFSEWFTKYSIPQLTETISVYENLRHGDKEFQSLFDDIEKYTGVEKELYQIIVRLFKNKPLYYAKTIEDILKSNEKEGVYEERLIYLFAGRYDIDLKNIIDAYNQQSKTGLRADFEAWDTSKWAKSFHPIILNIIDKASKMP